jgi:hypothetical protein
MRIKCAIYIFFGDIMKLILYILLFIVPFSLFSMEKEPISNELPAATFVSICCDPAISAIPIEDLRTVRSKSAQDKEALFEKMKVFFPIEKAITELQKLENPQVIVWFTNYFGSVMSKTLAWYTQNLFSRVKNGTFWLTDLKAWSFLSVDKEQLQKTYPELVSRINALQEAKTSGKDISSSVIPLSECPLVTKASDVVNETLNTTTRYRSLSSKEFFNWLLQQNKEASLVNSELCNQLCKDYPREDSLHFSLSDIGYKPELLNKVLEKLNNKTLVDVDFSMTYPILQYLEGIYYASEVIKQYAKANPAQKECSIVLMLPNKEFTYYTLPAEKEYFENFCKGVQVAALQYNNPQNPIKATIRFAPFAYGSDFYDAPYKFSGGKMTKNALLKALNNQENA